MATRRQTELERRQGQLLARSEQLRDAIADDAQVLRRPLDLVDQARAGWRWLRAHPPWALGAVAVVVLVVRPRRVWRLSTRLFWGWRTWRRVRPALRVATALLLATRR